MVPVLEPEHDQVQGLELETADCAPYEQRLAVGFEGSPEPLAVPHTPFNGAKQLSFVPPFEEPLHDQLKEPSLLVETEDTELEEAQRLGPLGFVVVPTPSAVPHTPLIRIGAEQEAGVPVSKPLHVQDQGPEPETAEAVLPPEQSPLVGAEVKIVPLAGPQMPEVKGAEQVPLLLPPFKPKHDQVQGPEP
jgi:hypothetical protein